jgi:phosphoribosylglycinamide formyltransferase 1
MPSRIAILASGTGSNAREIIRYFQGSRKVQIALVVTGNSDAGVVQVAHDAGVPLAVVDRSDLTAGRLLKLLQGHRTDLVVLAGFMWLLPPGLVQAFPKRIINIHPALLPKHGGKGMYGRHVHEAVSREGDSETGITIHYVNEHYDEGAIIAQHAVTIAPGTHPDHIRQKVQLLEHFHYPRVVEQIASDLTGGLAPVRSKEL